MKRRILSILCVLCLVVAMLPPVTASAAAPTTLTVGGTNVLDGSYWLTSDDGTLTADGASAENYNVYYDGDGTLTLNNANITGTSSSDYGAAIYAAGDLTIELEGSSSATGAVHSSDMPFSGLYVSGTLTISGEGSLTVNAVESTNSSKNNYGIYAVTYIQNGGSITSKSGTGAASRGVYAYSGMTVNGGSLTATGGTATGGSTYDSSGIYVTGPITVDGVTVTAVGGSGTNSYGIYSSTDTNSLTVTGGKVTATGSSSAIYIETYLPLNSSANNHVSVTVSNSGSITAQGGAGIVLKSSQMGGSTGTGSMTVESGSTLLANSVTVNNNPLAPTGEGSWLIYGQSGQTSAVGGNYTLTENVTIPSGVTVTVPADSTLDLDGHTLTVEGGLTIANQSSLTGSGTLAGDGTFTLTNPDPVISGGDDLTYDGTDQFSKFSLTAPTSSVEVMGKEFTISESPSTDSWELVDQEIKDAGTYTVTATNGTSTIKKEVTVEPAEISIQSATVQNKTYDGSEDATVTSVEFTGLQGSDALTINTDYTATAKFTSKNAGDSNQATVTVTLTNGNYTFANNEKTATSNATGTINQRPVELEWNTPTEFTYDGNEHSVAANISNTVNGDTVGLEYDSSSTTATDVGNYTATVSGLTGADAANYTLAGVQNLSLEWSIGKGVPDVTEPNNLTATYGATLADVVLPSGWAWDDNTTPVGNVGSNTFSATYKPTDTTNYNTVTQNLTVTVSAKDITGADITLGGALTYTGQEQTQQITSVTVGGLTVTYNISGNTGTDADTYTLTITGTGNFTGTVTKEWSIAKADPTDAMQTASGSVLANYPGSVTLPALPDGASYGSPSGSDVTGLTITDGILHYTGGDSIQKDQTYSVTIPVTGATNYNDYQITVTLTGTDKKVPTGAPTLSTTTITYGQPLSTITLSGSMQDGETNVPGTFAWDAPATTPNAGSYEARWTFTPENGTLYVPVSGTVTITVNKATPTGAPQYTAITTSGKTLADAGLTTEGGTFSVPGTVAWEQADTTQVQANTSYKWIFTPTDSENYNSISGTIELWHRSSSSGGSSSGTTTETEKNPDGSTTTTVTKPDGSTTETTKYPDGSKEVVETAKDGTVTTTTTDTAGNKTEVVENTDGSSKTTVDNKDGSGSVTVVDESGKVVSEATLSQAAVEAAQEKGEAVALPMPSVPVTTDRETAATVTVDLPSGTSAKVEIPVENVTSGTVAVIVKADGTEEVIKTSLTTENGVAVTLSDGDTVKIVDNSKAFDDVSDGYWAAEMIDFATSRELFAGTSETTFSPNTAMSRAMIVTVLARLDGVDTSAGGTWYEAGQQWAIANGVSDGTNMDQSLSREELATMLWRYAGQPASSGGLSAFPDGADTSAWAETAMSWAAEQGLFRGNAQSALEPRREVSRAEVAAVLQRFIAKMM